MTWRKVLSVHWSRIPVLQGCTFSHADSPCSCMEAYTHGLHAVMVV